MRLLLGISLILASFAAIGKPCQSLQEYDRITSIVTEQFYDKTWNGLAWMDRVATYRTEIKCTDSAEKIATTVNALLSELEASHTAVYTAADRDYWGLNSFFSFDDLDAYRINFSGIWPEQNERKWYARYVLEGSPAGRAGIRAGDQLIAVDGSDFQPIGFDGEPSTLTISSDGRTVKSVSIQTEHQSFMHGFIDASVASAKVLSVGDKDVGTFHLWAARDVILETMNDALARYEAARIDALIIDFGGGYGGTSEDYLNALRESDYLREIPVYFLIDDSVRSGKEMLAAIVKRDELGTLIGSRTAGAFLGGRIFRLFNNKYFLAVAVRDGTLPGLGRIEGIGVEPDIWVAPCKVYCAGRDPQLDRAIELITG